jgi:hypothetical protein
MGDGEENELLCGDRVRQITAADSDFRGQFSDTETKLDEGKCRDLVAFRARSALVRVFEPANPCTCLLPAGEIPDTARFRAAFTF